MRHGNAIIVYLCALISISCPQMPAYAQQVTPMDSIPDGRRVPGWLLDGVGFANKNQVPKPKDQFGIRGSQSSLAPSSLTKFSGIGPFTIYYGRAFLKIDYPGIYTFVISGDIPSVNIYASCFIDLKVGGADVANGEIHTKKVNTPSVGNINLTTGYYRIEYVIECQKIYDANYSIQIRGPDDAKARYFGPNELFHVLR